MKPTEMPLSLPTPIAAYFTADRGEGEAVSQCFTVDGIVKDESHTHKGRDAIKSWKTAASTKYQYTVEPFAYEAKQGTMVVTAHVVGNFPGSPVDLRFHFKVEGDKIASLEILP